MANVTTFAAWIAVVAVAGLAAIFSSRLSESIRVPAPAIFLVGAAIAADLVPALHGIPVARVQPIVTIALVFILFDGGMHIGWRRFRSAAGTIVGVGVIGTFLTAGAVALAAHAIFGFDWPAALLLGTALSPTDPAVVFSVLGKREVAGRSGVIIEGESGANDPVGIALMASLLLAADTGRGVGSSGTGHGGLATVATGVGEFALQMVVGAAVGLLFGYALIRLVQRVPLPSEALYPLRTLAAAGIIYGVATVAHGSGFLAVFVAGIMLGDVRAPYKREIRRMHASTASLSEIVAFTALGLTIDLRQLFTSDAWWIGLCLAALLALVIRPLLVGPLLWPATLDRGERVLVLWAGLKGAVPILLGTFVFVADVPDALLIYHIIFVVVLFSVVVQGGLVPWVANRCRVPMRLVEPEPWSLGLRFRDEPQGLHRYVVGVGSPADGRSIDALELGEGVWISFVSRAGNLLPITNETVLRADDEVLAMVDPSYDPDPAGQFTSDG